VAAVKVESCRDNDIEAAAYCCPVTTANAKAAIAR
jgi:hypothetical protein